MTLDDIRAEAMRQSIRQGLAVICTMPGREPVSLYFTSPESRDDFMRRAEHNGVTVTIAVDLP